MVNEEKKVAEETTCKDGLNVGISNSDAQKGILKSILSKAVAKRFTSKPIDLASDTTLRLELLPSLTQGEQEYLQELIASEDQESIQRATTALADCSVFPTEQKGEEEDTKVRPTLERRDSKVQQELFRLHDSRRRVMISNSFRKDSILESCPSIIESGDDGEPNSCGNVNNNEKDRSKLDNDENSANFAEFRTSFEILGTTADDISCHPHVLSPPLMESILEFVPETLSDYNFWIKYSLVRDGISLWTLLRHVRASSDTILAIETTDGQVFGAFTSSPWRLASSESKFLGSKDSFLWKMRKSRLESQKANVAQALIMESELVVFPFTGRNNDTQSCSVDGIGFGEGTNAIRLDVHLRHGKTAPSETFGNPCLTDSRKESDEFEIANLEVWTLTPKDNIKDAARAELSGLFLEGQRDDNSLNLLGILTGRAK